MNRQNGDPRFDQHAFASHNRLLNTVYELADVFGRLANCFCHAHLTDSIDFLEKILSGVMPVPYQTRCMCPNHADIFGTIPAKFFLQMCETLKQEAIDSNINLNTVIVESIVIDVRTNLPTSPLHVQMWCSLEQTPNFETQTSF